MGAAIRADIRLESTEVKPASLIYLAAAEHYYEKHARDVDGIFTSARIP